MNTKSRMFKEYIKYCQCRALAVKIFDWIYEYKDNLSIPSLNQEFKYENLFWLFKCKLFVNVYFIEEKKEEQVDALYYSVFEDKEFIIEMFCYKKPNKSETKKMINTLTHELIHLLNDAESVFEMSKYKSNFYAENRQYFSGAYDAVYYNDPYELRALFFCALNSASIYTTRLINGKKQMVIKDLDFLIKTVTKYFKNTPISNKNLNKLKSQTYLLFEALEDIPIVRSTKYPVGWCAK